MPRKAKSDDVNLRGEITIELEGQEYILRPSFEAIESIEEATGQTLFDLAGDATQGKLSFKVMGIIVAAMMRAYGKSHPEDPLFTTYRSSKPERLSELIYEFGGPRVTARITVLLVGALTGGYTASGEAKAVET